MGRAAPARRAAHRHPFVSNATSMSVTPHTMRRMAADASFPYTPTPGKLEDFLKKLQGMGVPGKIDYQYLGAVGFASSNCRPFIPIMKKVGLLDGAGKPTELYTKGLRGG